MKRSPLKLSPGTVGIAEAKRDLTKLIDRVEKTGTPLTIARRGKPIVQLVPAPKPRFWQWRPELAFPDDDPFWEGEKITSAWRKKARIRRLK